MTQATNTHDRYDLATTGENAREQLSDIIQNISPTDTPFQTAIGRSTAKNTLVEWLGDELAAAASNSQIDGDEFSGSSIGGAERFGNYAQIAWKVMVVSRRAEAVTKAGRKSELNYMAAKLGKELKRDKEYVLVGGGARKPHAPATRLRHRLPRTCPLGSSLTMIAQVAAQLAY